GNGDRGRRRAACGASRRTHGHRPRGRCPVARCGYAERTRARTLPRRRDVPPRKRRFNRSLEPGGRSPTARLGRGEVPPVTRPEGAMSDLVLGIDVGTSGVRVAAIDQAGHVAAFATSTMPAPLRDGPRITQDPALWARALDDAMASLGSAVDLARIG